MSSFPSSQLCCVSRVVTFGGSFDLCLHFVDGGRIRSGLGDLLSLLGDLSLQPGQLALGRLKTRHISHTVITHHTQSSHITRSHHTSQHTYTSQTDIPPTDGTDHRKPLKQSVESSQCGHRAQPIPTSFPSPINSPSIVSIKSINAHQLYKTSDIPTQPTISHIIPQHFTPHCH